MLRRHPRSLRARQLAPPALLVGLVASAVLAAAGLGAAALLPGTYAAVLFAVPIGSAGARREPRAAILLPAVLATMHLAWAAGFLLSPLEKVGDAWPDFANSASKRR